MKSRKLLIFLLILLFLILYINYKLENDSNEIVFKYVDLPLDYTYGSNAIPLAVSALATTGDMLELGMGFYSTKILHKISQDYGRKLVSIDTDSNWIDQFKEFNSTELHNIFLVNKTELFTYGSNKNWSIVLVDHTDGVLRSINAKRFYLNAQIVLLHDAEDSSEKYYFYKKNRVYSYFKYTCKYSLFNKNKRNYVSTVLLSNFINMKEIEESLKKIKTEFGHAACNSSL